MDDLRSEIRKKQQLAISQLQPNKLIENLATLQNLDVEMQSNETTIK